MLLHPSAGKRNVMTPGNSNKRSRPVTLKDIANHCGVGKSIVSYALRNVPCVRRETRERILAAAVELGYDPAAQESARRLVAQRHPRKLLNHLIALILPNDFYRVTYFGSMFRGVMEVLLPAGYDVLIMHPMGQDAHAVIGSPSIRRGDVDGVIAFHPSDLDEHDLASLRNHVNFRNRPIISLINPLPTCTSVLTDDEAGAYAATQHLLAQGHRHLLTFVTWVEASAARLRGVTSALRDAGLDPGAPSAAGDAARCLVEV